MRTAVFLDRDGTIIEDVPYLDNVAGVKLLPRAAAAVKRLSETGFRVIGITNQSGVARGLVSEAVVRQVNEYIRGELAHRGANLERFYYCPHHPDFSGPCDCRKPAPGMLLRAAADYDLDLSRSYFIGDNVSDVEAGRRAGCHTVRLPGKPANNYPPPPPGHAADHMAANLTAAVDWVLAQPLPSPSPRGEAGAR